MRKGVREECEGGEEGLRGRKGSRGVVSMDKKDMII